MKYVEPKWYSHIEILKIKKENDTNQIMDMLIGVAFNEDDLEFAFNICSEYIDSEHDIIVGTALESLAHLARRFKSLPNMELKKIIRKCEKRLPSEEINGGLYLLKNDLEVFCPNIYAKIFT